MPLIVNAQVIDDAVLDNEFSGIKAYNESLGNVSCCERDPEFREQAKQNVVGRVLLAQEAARRMLPRGSGSIFFTGATAGVKGFARSSVFAMGKFAVRGLAQSLARELGPAGIHVVHFVIDGAVVQGSSGSDVFSPKAIARSYMAALRQPPGAWSWELELRSHNEPF